MSIIGYKCFNNNLINRYGFKFEVGSIYAVPKPIKYGIYGNGFHMCKNFEDTFRYFDAMNEEVILCEVMGSGKVVKYNDEYYGYYNMYSVEKLEILNILNRCDILEKALNLDELRAERFVSLYRLNKEEIDLFKETYKWSKKVLDAISYYQESNKKVYKIKKD